jgi:hypothetical protein
MMKLLVLIQVFFQGPAVPAQGPDTVISCHYHNTGLAAFCQALQAESGVRIYYQDQWVAGINVTLDADSISVRSALERTLEGTELNVSVWNGSLVIHPGDKLPESLPVFTGSVVISGVELEAAPGLTQTEERYLTGRQADVTQTITVGSKSLAKANGKVSILGRITDQETGEPVIGATMYLEEIKSGTATDLNGYLSMMLNPGNYTAVFEFMGMEKKKYLLSVLSEGKFSIEMKKSVIQMKEVVVYGDRQMNIQMKEPGLEKITTKTIKEIPMLTGERDILGVSEMLPGIVTVGEGSAGLNVRGGNYDQNAFFINRVPVYSTSHVFGFFPAFNADIIKDFSIYKGYVPARYGGKLSSVFNLYARQGNRKKFTARGGISPVAANLTVEAPLKKDISSFILSGRYLYSDWILGQINDPVIRESSAGFMDFSATLNYDFKKGQLTAFGYYSHDNFRMSDLSRYEYGNTGTSLLYSHNFSTSFRGEFALTASWYSFGTIDEQEISSAYEYAFGIGDYAATADFRKELSNRNVLEFGGGMTLYRLDRGTIEPYGVNSIREPVMLGKEQGIESSVYLSDEYTVLPWLNITAGFRLMLFNPLGPSTVYIYAPDGPKDPRYIVDSISYDAGQAIKWYVQPEIRAAVNFRTDENGSVKVAFNQMHQNMFMLSNTIALSPNSQWKLADYYIQPAAANLVSAGVFRTFPGQGLEASVELYYKKIRNATEFIDGADFLNTPQVETSVLQGDQKAYGIECLLRRNGRRFEGWLAYTWSRSIVQVDGDQPWEQINSGKAFPSNYDIPHVLNSILIYHFSRRVSASAVVTYQTGKPATYPESVFYVNGIPYVDYSERNSYRIPDYFRIDLSLTLEGNLRRHKFIHNSLSFSLYNVTGRDNPYSVYFKIKDGKITGYQYSVIGVPIFTVTWLFKLGNYASD